MDPPITNLTPFVFDQTEAAFASLEPPSSDRRGGRERGGGGGGGGGRMRGGREPGQHASRRQQQGGDDGGDRPKSDFWDRIMRGYNKTKVGSNTNPRDVASQIAAQARAAVDCPILQCIGPSSTNQAIKAIAIARTYLSKSDASGSSAHPDLVVYPEFIKLDQQPGENEGPISAMQLVLTKRVRHPPVEKEGRSLKVSSSTEAKSLAGAIASCTREGSRVELTAIGAGSVNQAIKAVAIARQYVEEEAIDLCLRPEFVEIAESAEREGGMSALRLIVLVEQT